MKTLLPALAILTACTCAACTAAQVQEADRAGQLFCAFNTASGPIVAGMIVAGTAVPAAIIATNATEAFVNAVCAAKGGIAVSPPANPAVAPQIAVVPPATVPTDRKEEQHP